MSTAKEVVANDGGEINLGDFNDAQRFLRSQLNDGVLASMFRTSDMDYAGRQTLLGQTSMKILGNAAAPTITGSSLVVTLLPGWIAQIAAQGVAGGDYGSEADTLMHYLGGSEDTLTYTSAAGSVGNPRWDILQARIDQADVSATRHFKDATTGLFTSTPFTQAQRRTRFNASIKQGTAAGSPTIPTADAGYVTLFAWRIEAGATAITAANFRDYRMPAGLSVIDVVGRHMTRTTGFSESSDGYLIGDGAAVRTAYAWPQMAGGPWRTGRVVAVGLSSDLAAASGGSAVLERGNFGVNPVAYTTLLDLSSTLVDNSAALAFRGALLFDQAIWMDGTNAPTVQGSLDFNINGFATSHALLYKLALTLRTGATHADTFAMARFVVAGM